MICVENKSKCSGCYACYNICPQKAITMVEDQYGFKYPIINKKLCINCDLCKKVCYPKNKTEKEKTIKAYACFSKDETTREKSSSGGLFSVIAEYILDNNGIVYGAAFSDEWKVKHIRIDNKEQLDKLRTSKYVQSQINDCYKLVKKDLESGKKVLFTGTPCQVNGLLKYINNVIYDNLFTQDIICHGVPSPKVWEKYVEYRKIKDRDEIKNINFRRKNNGWKQYGINIDYKEKGYFECHNKDLYMQAFLRNASLRDSCYQCASKTKYRNSDITLADFWGIENVAPEMDDNKGTSLVLLNSEKGQNLFNEVKDKIIYKETDFENSIKYNSAMVQSVKIPMKRDEFFENIDKLNFKKIVKKYTDFPKKDFIIIRILRKVKKIFIKICRNEKR